MEILSAEEWIENNYDKTSIDSSRLTIADGYAKYLLEKQAEFIAEKGFYGNFIIEASNEFIKQLDTK